MAVLRAFKAIRPTKDKAAAVAALPYDVLSTKEAREIVKQNPISFLRIDKAEVDLPEGTDLYADEVYLKAKENLESYINDGIFIQDEKPCLYIYRQIMDGRAQTGIVGCLSIDDYVNNVIKKHELTRADKEVDRFRHVDTCDAHTGPIFITYKGGGSIDEIIAKYEKTEPEYDFVSCQGVRQIVWIVSDETDINRIIEEFKKINSLYIADGHHRSASAVHVGLKRRKELGSYTGEEEFNFFLAVVFKCEDLKLMDYNRLLKDSENRSAEEIIRLSEKNFYVTEKGAENFRPSEKHTFGLYLDGLWYELRAKDGTFDENDPVDRLDVTILQKNFIAPVFGIEDPRTDDRIDFVGGIRGLDGLKRRVDENGWRAAVAMYPTTIDDLMSISDAGLIMPPKSTWFEPKLLSGLFIHKLSD
ncbi:MAG: DUF1015 domain-containing protein [Clostridiales bacterium]|nr:DUF1015 domain-containing protein [Clostridiales bacterium]